MTSVAPKEWTNPILFAAEAPLGAALLSRARDLASGLQFERGQLLEEMVFAKLWKLEGPERTELLVYALRGPDGLWQEIQPLRPERPN